jgi:hypothetical protein
VSGIFNQFFIKVAKDIGPSYIKSGIPNIPILIIFSFNEGVMQHSFLVNCLS